MNFKEYKHYVIIVFLFVVIGTIIIVNSNKEIGLVGIVTNISKVEDSKINLTIEENEGNDKKNIQLDPMSIVYRGNKFMHISIDELKTGDEVEVIFKGKVDKSKDNIEEVVQAIRIVE